MASKFADAATLAAVHEVVSSDAPDPVALRRIDWELTPFYCPDCDLNCCRAEWETFRIFDEGDLREQVRQDTWKSVGVRGDCHPVSHPALRTDAAVVRGLTLNCQASLGVR